MNAMNRFANSTQAPDFDAPQILRHTRRRRTIGIAAITAALIAAGGGTALATTVAASGGSSSTPAATSTATTSDNTTMLFDDHGVTVSTDFSRMNLVLAEQALLKTQTKLGTVTKETVKGCKPGSILGVSPHAPTIVKEGDTVNFTVCAG